MGDIFFVSALTHQADVEFYGLGGGFQADALVVAMDGGTLFGGQVHGGEAVDVVAQIPVMPGIGALHHQVWGNDAARPGVGHGGGDLFPGVTAGFGNGAGLKA